MRRKNGGGEGTEARGQRSEIRGGDQNSQAAAYILLVIFRDARNALKIYRRLAQATEKSALTSCKKLRDRLADSTSLESVVSTYRNQILAGERGVSIIEVKEDKLMLTRNNDFVMVGSKFPRLTKKQATARLNEIKRLLLSL